MDFKILIFKYNSMGMNCKKCGMYKMTEGQKCMCNVKKFDEARLSKKTREEKKPTEIKKVSDKKAQEIKERGSLISFYAKIAKSHFDENGDGKCEFCGDKFNIVSDFVDNRVAFAHILAKGDVLYKHLATFKNNVALVCGESCHKGMDAEICRLGIKNILKEKIENGEKIDVGNLSSYL